MKVSDLIERLTALDPTGELDVCLKGDEDGNVDVVSVQCLPGYYDGPAQRLVRDASGRIVEAVFCNVPDKICLESQSIRDAVDENPELPVSFDRHPSGQDLEKLERWREIGRSARASLDKK